MSTISAPNLTIVGSSLSIVNDTSLTNTSFPKLTSIGGAFLIANNTDLSIIGGFDNVQTVAGAIDWTGNFNNASLPSIQNVQGGVNVQSSSDTFQCPFPQIQSNGVVKGKGFICTGKVANPSSGVNGSNVTANSQSGSNGKTSGTERLTNGLSFTFMAILVGFAMQYLV
jgi:hypothetical protein